MNTSEMLAYIELPDNELQKVFSRNPLLIRALQRNCPSPEFMPRLIRNALESSMDHLRHIVTPGYSNVIIDFLRGVYDKDWAIARALLGDLPEKAVDQAMFDYVIGLGKTYSLNRVAQELLTEANILAAVMVDSCQISYIPDALFTPELSVLIFKAVPSAYCCLSPLANQKDIIFACTSYLHLCHLNEVNFEAFYERWRYTTDMRALGWNPPTPAEVTLRTLYAATKLPNNSSEDKAMQQGSVRLMKRSLLDDGVEKVWAVADSSDLQSLVKNIFGKAILNIRSIPGHMKRELLSDDLGM